ncbi:MAG: DNA-formamidopyrimidine glycosylase family protein [Corynebacterium sp.]|nr:DNA-formamidopyrimidine glycosylase family protein [Corynebacterium sp.]
MPEGDSIYQLSKRLQWMTGREITATDIRVPRYATADFGGQTVQKVWPYGKHLFMRFEQEILQTHLKMEGSWAIYQTGQRWKKPGYLARVVLTMDQVQLVGFQLGMVRVYPAAEYSARIADLGPDVLGVQWSEIGEVQAKANLLAQPTRAIGLALLDQRVLAGVGNEYRAEICFLLGIHPATPIAAVDVDATLDLTRRLMWDNRNSVLRVTTGIAKPGRTTYVFGRNHKPCRRCGTRIQKSSLVGDITQELERIIWWCPQCQPYRDVNGVERRILT